MERMEPAEWFRESAFSGAFAQEDSGESQTRIKGKLAL